METIVIIWLVVLTFFGVVDYQKIEQLDEKAAKQEVVTAKVYKLNSRGIDVCMDEIKKVKKDTELNAEVMKGHERVIEDLENQVPVVSIIDRRTGEVVK